MKKVIVIVGPTASGKTKFSIELAKKIKGEIINGDSVQVYKELNIGSAKISHDEMEDVKHHLLSIVSIKDSYSAYQFQKDVRKKINEIDIPIIVGGTGFYIKSALYNYEFQKENNDEELDYLTNEELYLKLIELDKSIVIDKNNRHRLIRALNQALSGNLRSQKTKKDEALYDLLIFYLDIDRDELKKKLVKRLEIQMQEGFLDEVIETNKIRRNLNIIGYRELNMYLNSELSLDESKDAIIRASMKLAKRQKTWFKNQMIVININPLDSNASKTMFDLVNDFLKK